MSVTVANALFDNGLTLFVDKKSEVMVMTKLSSRYWTGLIHGLRRQMIDVITVYHRLSLAGRKLRISPVETIDSRKAHKGGVVLTYHMRQ